MAEFEQQWKALGKQILEMKLQQTIQAIENGQPHSHRKRTAPHPQDNQFHRHTLPSLEAQFLPLNARVNKGHPQGHGCGLPGLTRRYRSKRCSIGFISFLLKEMPLE